MVMTLVITSGQFSRTIPCTTKRMEPRPSMQNVGIAMPSVFLVRMVAIACGIYPSTMQTDAAYPTILSQSSFMRQIFKSFGNLQRAGKAVGPSKLFICQLRYLLSLSFSRVQMLTRFHDSSSNMFPMPSPCAEIRSAGILYFLTSAFFTDSARLCASLMLKS